MLREFTTGSPVRCGTVHRGLPAVPQSWLHDTGSNRFRTGFVRLCPGSGAVTTGGHQSLPSQLAVTSHAASFVPVLNQSRAEPDEAGSHNGLGQ
ncbi:unnamed protein product [Calypogeia fissa]